MSRELGLAADVGTTTVVLAVVELATGTVVATRSFPNPQSQFGPDVMTRIAFAQSAATNADALHAVLVREINMMVTDALDSADLSREEIAEAVFVGNATMMHTLIGMDPAPLGVSPYRGALEGGWEGKAGAIGIELPFATLRVPPGIRSHVGADTVAAIIATGFDEVARSALLIDIGTNSEVVLAHGGSLLCTSTAAGPAFEDLEQNARLRGSQLISAVAERLRAGVIDESGRIAGPDRAVEQGAVRQLQLAKAGVAAAIRILLARAGIQPLQIDSIVLAGAFGNYIIPNDALRIGLLPDVPVERVGFASDAALAGAQLLVTSASARARAAAVASRARYVELGGHHGYSDAFVEEIPFPSARGRLLAGLSQLTTDMTLQSLQRCPYRAAFDVCTFRGPCRNRIRVQPRSARCGGGPLNHNPV